MDMPAYALHPQSLLMETTWVCSWFTRLLKKMSDLKSAGGGNGKTEQIFIADRSPFSACFYSRRGGSYLDPVIREQIQEIREAAGIEVYTVYMKVDNDILWERIQNRLEMEPDRRKYDEDKREWMEKTVRFYEDFQWDLVVENNDITMPVLMQKILQSLAVRSPQLRQIMSQSDSPGRSYFRKRLGSTDVLRPMIRDDETKENWDVQNEEIDTTHRLAENSEARSLSAVATPNKSSAVEALGGDFADADFLSRERLACTRFSIGSIAYQRHVCVRVAINHGTQKNSMTSMTIPAARFFYVPVCLYAVYTCRHRCMYYVMY